MIIMVLTSEHRLQRLEHLAGKFDHKASRIENWLQGKDVEQQRNDDIEGANLAEIMVSLRELAVSVRNIVRDRVGGKSVGDILLDTGCSRTLVHQRLVSENKLKEGDAVAIRCAHGDTVLYPLADIVVE